MRKKILLTGGNGFIGKNIQESFLAGKYDITAPRSCELDLTDTKAVDDFFRTHTFDVVVHAACKPGHRNAKDRTQLFETNLQMFENLVRHTDKFGKLINLGSGAIYDISADNRLVTEEQIGEHIGKDAHSACKYAVYKRIETLPNIVDLNIFGIFGKYEDWEIRFPSNSICKTLYDLPITLRQNRRFSYLYVNDLMPILEFFIENDTKYSSYNICPDISTSILEVAQIVKKISDKDVEIKVGKDGFGYDYTGNNNRLHNEFKELKFTDLETSLRELYTYYENNKDKIDKNLLMEDK